MKIIWLFGREELEWKQFVELILFLTHFHSSLSLLISFLFLFDQTFTFLFYFSPIFMHPIYFLSTKQDNKVLTSEDWKGPGHGPWPTPLASLMAPTNT